VKENQMAKTKNTSGEGTPVVETPAPKISPPGKVVSKSVAGIVETPKSFNTPMERLRAVLHLSNETPDDQVLIEAARRIEQGVEK
jgi:hypothetical protein